MHEKRIPPAIRVAARELGAGDILPVHHNHSGKTSFGLKFDQDESFTVAGTDLPNGVEVKQVCDGRVVFTNSLDPVEVSAL